VCAASGDLPNADCPQTATTWYIPGKSPIRVSDIHRRIWFDTRTGQQACPPYDARFVRDATYTLRAARVGGEAIPLAATADGGVRSLHWFVDDAYVGTTKPDSTVSWTPGRSGAFLVRAIDDQGRADSRELRVAVVP
jgi:penicillin-binding protein 1C